MIVLGNDQLLFIENQKREKVLIDLNLLANRILKFALQILNSSILDEIGFDRLKLILKYLLKITSQASNLLLNSPLDINVTLLLFLLSKNLL